MIDNEIMLDISKLPQLLIDCIKKLEYYDKINDEDMYIATLEVLETTAKSYVLENKLSKKEYKIILKKFAGELSNESDI